MAIDTKAAFRFLQVNYKYGNLDKMSVLVGEVLDDVIEEAELDMEDLLNRVESVNDETLDKADRYVPRILKVLSLMSGDRMTRFQSRLLDVPLFRRWIVAGARAYFSRALKGKENS
ncbi:MAG: hypothetical protein GY864_05270 [Desulfobacterales bacterium]|nr:hypothetical protein [Desulfobacterales bacterium]